jgi:DNA-binding HxlR family transcriptional regulator
MNEQIIEIITSRGESLMRDIKIPGVNPQTLMNTLVRLVNSGKLNRRLIPAPRRPMWAYSLSQSTGPYLRNEPDYVYFLRNLGRNDEHHSC